MDENSDAMNINELHEELLVNIFEYLKEDDMKTAADVCPL
jgi:hypothetical protein